MKRYQIAWKLFISCRNLICLAAEDSHHCQSSLVHSTTYVLTIVNHWSLCVFHMKHTPDAVLSFINNFKLSQQARREIIIGSLFRGSALLPGREVPAEFHHHRARGNSLTIPHLRFALWFPRTLRKTGNILTSQLLCCRIFGKDDLYPTDREFYIGDDVSNYRAEHLFIFHSHLLDDYINPANVRTEIMFEFSSPSSVFNITECGAKICTQQTIQGSYESGSERLYILHTLK